MTEFEKLIAKYTDTEQYLKTAGFYHVATRVWEIETRKLIDVIVEREGYGDDLERITPPSAFLSDRTTYADGDRQNVAFAIPRRYYHQKDGNLEVERVEVIWFNYRYADDEHRYPTDENETVIPITEDDERRLMELTNLYDTARKDIEAVKRTAVINLFNANGIKTGEFMRKLETVRGFADGLVEAVTKEDAKHLQEIQHDQITALEGIGDDTRADLIRFFCPEYHEADEKTKSIQLACAYSNFAYNYITAIPESYLHELAVISNGKKERTDEEEQRHLLIRESQRSIDEKTDGIALNWYYEIGGDYVKEQEETPAEDEVLQQFAESEAVIQDYTSPKQHIYSLTKAQRGIFDDPELADEITLLDNGQLEYTFAVSRADAKTQRAVILDIADKVKGLTKFDKSVINAVFSIIEAGNTTFTSKQVAIQTTQNKVPNKNTVGAYTKSIDKMRTILHKVDVTEHYKLNNGDADGLNKLEVEGYLLPVEAITITMNNGTKVKGYGLIKHPVLLAYAKETKQIHTVSNEVLNVPVNKTEKVIIMRDYLIQQIGIIYNAHSKVSNNILISTVLDYAGFDLMGMDRRRRAEQINHIKNMIEYWNKIKYIEYGYKFNYKGKTLESITINPRPKAKKK